MKWLSVTELINHYTHSYDAHGRAIHFYVVYVQNPKPRSLSRTAEQDCLSPEENHKEAGCSHHHVQLLTLNYLKDRDLLSFWAPLCTLSLRPDPLFLFWLLTLSPGHPSTTTTHPHRATHSIAVFFLNLLRKAQQLVIHESRPRSFVAHSSPAPHLNPSCHLCHTDSTSELQTHAAPSAFCSSSQKLSF